MTQPKCKEGYWTFGDVKAMVCLVKGNELAVKNIVSLDYPDIKSSWDMTLEYGNFGDAKKEITEVTGAQSYNVKLASSFFGLKAVLNTEGTQMNIWGFTNKMEIWNWITPEKVKEMAEDRDDAEAPR